MIVMLRELLDAPDYWSLLSLLMAKMEISVSNLLVVIFAVSVIVPSVHGEKA
jgi:hypothetical protein